ncbi:hypothetical protein JZ751_013371 [Albula glossodonta]|uniref:V-type proton ATPase subunit a n=1 Tax=Albula glossodonta TaxID=121402 RepID=A0A8T2MVS2_9TELE|nr:hypothetical protein JZ751_013371 [Albula glossodonta]
MQALLDVLNAPCWSPSSRRCPKQWDIAKILEELEEQFGTAVCPPPRPPLPQVLSQTECFLGQLLAQVEEVLPCWKVRVWKCKAVHAVLNLCSPSVTDKCLIAEAWCPLSQLPALQGALTEGGVRENEREERKDRKSGSGVDSFYNCLSPPTSPPTLFSTNSFTAGFQSIVDTYGVANYREVNPAMFTIITFPFLFAVMFGDVGHGMLLTLLALWMLLQERDPKLSTSGNEVGPPTRDTPTAMAHCKGKCIIMVRLLFGGRYVLLLMGLFSVYTGAVYNECFSRGLSLFPSSWHLQPMMRHYNWSDETLHGNQYLTLDPSVEGVFQGPYPFGIDPVWRLATNHLTFLNSYKMKMSVIIGVVHMTFGVCLSFFNYMRSGELSSVFLVLVPELVFMLSLFGYLVFMVVLKWLTCGPLDSDRAPSVLMHFINMFLLTQSKENPPLYPGQEVVQRVLVLLALCSVPVLLLGRPVYLYMCHRRKINSTHSLLSDTSSINALQGDLESGQPAEEETGDQRPLLSDTSSINALQGDLESGRQAGEETEFDVVEVFMYQAIHTIEYCLGCISNTASYLRLWALSLAHSRQLPSQNCTSFLRACLDRGGVGVGDSIACVERSTACMLTMRSCPELSEVRSVVCALTARCVAELSEVLWVMVLRVSLAWSGWVGSVVLVGIFSVFALLTVSILLLMEGLSAFLHALRLHCHDIITMSLRCSSLPCGITLLSLRAEHLADESQPMALVIMLLPLMMKNPKPEVEFQNKFYSGSGYKLSPFSFTSSMNTL